MGEVLVGLVGVVVGGVITTASAWLVERQRDKRDERAHEREERQATRMVHQELLTIQLELDSAIENETWWSRKDLEFTTVAWERFGHVVAATDIDENSWAWITHAYNEIERLNEAVRRRWDVMKGAGRTSRPMFDKEVLNLTAITQTSVEQGVDFLQAYMYGEPSPALSA